LIRTTGCIGEKRSRRQRLPLPFCEKEERKDYEERERYLILNARSQKKKKSRSLRMCVMRAHPSHQITSLGKSGGPQSTCGRGKKKKKRERGWSSAGRISRLACPYEGGRGIIDPDQKKKKGGGQHCREPLPLSHNIHKKKKEKQPGERGSKRLRPGSTSLSKGKKKIFDVPTYRTEERVCTSEQKKSR